MSTRQLKKSCKSVIVRFSTFCHRTIVYRTKKNLKCSVRVKIDLTKKIHNLLVSTNKYVSNIDSVKFFYADNNCRLNIRWEDESINDPFFDSLAKWKSHVNADECKLKSSCFILNSMSNPCHYGKLVFAEWLGFLNPVLWNWSCSRIHSQVLVFMWSLN